MLKKIAVVLLITLFSVNIYGCTFRESKNQESVVISFSFWGNESRYDKTMAAVEAFEDKYPNIKVNIVYGEWTGFVDKMKVLIMANNEPDLMQINYDWINKFSKDGTGFYDLSKLNEVLELNQYSDELLDYGSSNDILNGIPIAMNSKVFFYNKTLGDKYGIDKYDTWDSLFEARNKIPEGEYPLELDSEHSWILSTAYIREKTGKDFINRNGTLEFSKDDIKDLLNFYKNLIDKKIIPLPNTIKDKYLGDNRAIAGYAWQNQASKYSKSAQKNNSDIEIGEIPSASGNNNIKFVKPAMLYGISKNTQYPEEAALLMKFLLTDDEAVKDIGVDRGIPSNPKAVEILENNNQLEGIEYEFNKNNSNAKEVVMNPYFENASIKNICIDSINSIAYNEMSVDECAESTYTHLVNTLQIILYE